MYRHIKRHSNYHLPSTLWRTSQHNFFGKLLVEMARINHDGGHYSYGQRTALMKNEKVGRALQATLTCMPTTIPVAQISLPAC